LNVSISTTINSSADSVWKAISDFQGIDKYIPGIASSAMEGSGVGALRTLRVEDGGTVVERLESLNEQARTLSYSIVEAPLPVAGYVSTMQIRAIAGDRCELTWSSVFEPKGVSEAKAGKLMESIYSLGFDGLKKLLGG
jgi:hypothetical protein